MLLTFIIVDNGTLNTFEQEEHHSITLLQETLQTDLLSLSAHFFDRCDCWQNISPYVHISLCPYVLSPYVLQYTQGLYVKNCRDEISQYLFSDILFIFYYSYFNVWLYNHSYFSWVTLYSLNSQRIIYNNYYYYYNYFKVFKKTPRCLWVL